MNHLQIIKKLQENNFEALLVGGCTRDYLQDSEPKDHDIVTSARPNNIIELFEGQKTNEIGKSFGVVLVDGYEIATYRKDKYSENNTELDIIYSDSLGQDAERRDLTINSIYYDPINDKIIDPNNGKEDLKNKIIRFVGDPRTRIEEDECRILRACRFLAKIDGVFDKKTLKALIDNSHLLKFIAPERIRLEILKALKCKNTSIFFNALHIIGALKYIFPTLDSTYGHEHGIHHPENISEHSMLVGDSISTKFPMIKLAGYLHDCGKPRSFEISEGHNFAKHEIIGRDFVEEELKFLKFSNDEIQEISGLVRCHMNSLKDITPKATRRLLKRFDKYGVNPDSYLRLKFADRKGSVKQIPHTFSEIRRYIKILKDKENLELPFRVHDLALKGGEIRDIFGAEGKEIGKIQRMLLTKIVDDGISNEKEILIEESNKYLNGE